MADAGNQLHKRNAMNVLLFRVLVALLLAEVSLGVYTTEENTACRLIECSECQFGDPWLKSTTNAIRKFGAGTNKEDPTIDSCKSYCDTEEDCVGFNWNEGNVQCYFLGNITEGCIGEKSNVDLFEKQLPSFSPSSAPSAAPSASPVTVAPTESPTTSPITTRPSAAPTSTLTASPTTGAPTSSPTLASASDAPTTTPTTSPTMTAETEAPVAPTDPVPVTGCTAMGNWPLFCTQQEAVEASPSNTAHAMGQYWMPNDFVGAVMNGYSGDAPMCNCGASTTSPTLASASDAPTATPTASSPTMTAETDAPVAPTDPVPVTGCIVMGNWPLFCTQQEAVEASPSNTAHAMGQYWMPNDFVGAVMNGGYGGDAPMCNCTRAPSTAALTTAAPSSASTIFSTEYEAAVWEYELDSNNVSVDDSTQDDQDNNSLQNDGGQNDPAVGSSDDNDDVTSVGIVGIVFASICGVAFVTMLVMVIIGH